MRTRDVRVLQICHSFVVTEFRERSRILHTDHGYDVHLALPLEWPEAEDPVRAPLEDSLPLHVLDLVPPRHPTLFHYTQKSLRRVIRETRPHIVDVQEEAYSLAGRSILRALDASGSDAPVCIYAAQNIERTHPLPLRLAERRMLARAAAAFPCTPEAGDVLRRKGFNGPIHVIPLGVELPDAPRPAREGAPLIGFVGGLLRHKGAHVLLDAFAQLPAGEASLEIVGGGPELERLRRQAADLGLDTAVRFTGPLSQADAISRIAAFDLLVVPSFRTRRWMEQFGRVVAQAFAAGTPVLASDSGSLSSLVSGAGALVPEHDVPALAHALGELVRDPARRVELGVAGRRRAEAELTWPRIAERFDAMYRQVLGA